MFRYDTGICPRCGSKLTARLKVGRAGKRSFNFGSPIIYDPNPGAYNIICAECGIKWLGDIKFSNASKDLVEELRLDWIDEEDFRAYDKNSEEDLLNDMVYDMGLIPETEKKKKEPGPVRKMMGYTVKQTINAPVDAAQGLLSSVGGLVGDIVCNDTQAKRAIYTDNPQEKNIDFTD